MKHFAFPILVSATLLANPSQAFAYTVEDVVAAEVMLRTVSNQCGTPAFDREFVKQSKVYVKERLAAMTQQPAPALEQRIARRVNDQVVLKKDCAKFIEGPRERLQARATELSALKSAQERSDAARVRSRN